MLDDSAASSSQAAADITAQIRAIQEEFGIEEEALDGSSSLSMPIHAELRSNARALDELQHDLDAGNVDRLMATLSAIGATGHAAN